MVTEKKKTKLKKLRVSSVDMVGRGANQDAHIKLYKNERASPGVPEPIITDEIPQGLWKSVVEAVKGFLTSPGSPNDEPDEIKKADGDTEFKVEGIQKNRELYVGALDESIESIMKDESLDNEERYNMIEKSINQFSETYKDLYARMLNESQNINKATENPEDAVGVSESITPEGDRDMKIDKSRFDADELAQYEALIAKGLVEDDDDLEKECKPGVEKELPASPGKVHPEKAKEEVEEEMAPEVKKALADLEALKKSYEMGELKNVAKKYEVLGKKADEVANILYDLKKSGEANYNAYIAALDAQVDMVEKSGLFYEIGKSGNYNYTSVAKSEPETKIDAIAKGYMDKDPELNYTDAVAKAWERNTDLMLEYEKSAGF